MMMVSDLKTISQVINSKKRFVVSAHLSPDGDAIASQLAMARLLTLMGKEAIIVNDEAVPVQFKFLVEDGDILETVPDDFDPEAVVVIDTPVRDKINCGAIRDRFAEPMKPAEEAGDIGGRSWTDVVTIFLDHHQRSDTIGDYVYVDPTASAAATIVGRMMTMLDISPEPKIGTHLICGIMSDTGRFSFANTTPESLKIVASMVDSGANISEVATNLFYRNSFESMKVTGTALSTLEISKSGRVSTMVLLEEAVDEHGQTVEVEDLKNYPVSIRGVEIGIFLRPAGGNGVRVSVRATGEADVNKFADQYGGGGHKKAAGCRVDGPIEEARSMLIESAEKYLDETLS
jgi:bifunctional oligoribonuclease and PAP phosphatase NrnA